MVLKYYQLVEQPFGVTPDPRFLFMSATHREAIASIFHSVNSGRGFTTLIAEPGMGKTTLLFNLMQVLGTSAKTAFLFQAQDSPKNFVRNLLLDLGVEHDDQDLVNMHAKLNECLVRETSQGKHFIVVVDEAQNLDEPVLEVVRMLSNFETPSEKLMHIILAGQPQLASKLSSPQLTQLRQRISIVARLAPFTETETRSYIEHRLRVAGYRGEIPLFTDSAVSMIAKYSGGIPRNISNICFNAMSLSCATKQKRIKAASVEEVLSDLNLTSLGSALPPAEFQPQSTAIPKKGPGRLTAAFRTTWRRRAGIATLAALLLTGIGLGVVAKNPRSSTTQTLPSSPVNQPEILQAKSELDVSDSHGTAGSTPESSGDLKSTVSEATPIAPLPNSGSAINPDPSRPIEFTVVRVGAQDTLYNICMRNLGRYDSQLTGFIIGLNPGLPSPRRIRAGQEIRIPTRASLLKQTDHSAKRLGSSPSPEAKKQ
jgi:general secretion pathway protein A